jgi:hypothetical protein
LTQSSFLSPLGSFDEEIYEDRKEADFLSLRPLLFSLDREEQFPLMILASLFGVIEPKDDFDLRGIPF